MKKDLKKSLVGLNNVLFDGNEINGVDTINDLKYIRSYCKANLNTDKETYSYITRLLNETIYYIFVMIELGETLNTLFVKRQIDQILLILSKNIEEKEVDFDKLSLNFINT